MKKFANLQQLFLFVIILPLATCELSSCYRAKCTHCINEFIFKMCPTTCGSCHYEKTTQKFPSAMKIRPGRPNHNPISNVRVHAATITNTAPAIVSQPDSQKQKKLDITRDISAPQHNVAPTAQVLPETKNYQAQPNYNGYNTQQYQQKQVAYTGYLTPQDQQYLVQQPQTTSFGSSYATNYNPPVQLQYRLHQQGSQAIIQQQPSALLSPQLPQQPVALFGAPAQQQPPLLFGQQQEQQSRPLPSQPFNFFQQPTLAGQNPQSSRSQFFNPFQPFLQQSLQAQQQNPFFQPLNSFPQSTATPPTSLYRPFQAPSSAQLQQVAPALPNYFQPQAPIPSTPTQAQVPYAAGNQNIYLQNNGQPFEQQGTQNTAQFYNTQQLPQSSQGQVYATNPQPQNAASNIDTLPLYVNKNSYGEKSGGQFLTCPKQPKWEPCISKEIANERFRNCCQRLGEGCSQLCSYDQTLATIQIAVLTGRCPISKVGDMMICASGNEDATPCCQAYNVFEPGFEQCRPYCNPSAGLPNDGMLAEKYRCLTKLSQIQRCFFVTQKP